jgi:hypothetical protein
VTDVTAAGTGPLLAVDVDDVGRGAGITVEPDAAAVVERGRDPSVEAKVDVRGARAVPTALSV